MHSPKGEVRGASIATHERTSMPLYSMYGMSTHRWTKQYFGIRCLLGQVLSGYLPGLMSEWPSL